MTTVIQGRAGHAKAVARTVDRILAILDALPAGEEIQYGDLRRLSRAGVSQWSLAIRRLETAGDVRLRHGWAKREDGTAETKQIVWVSRVRGAKKRKQRVVRRTFEFDGVKYTAPVTVIDGFTSEKWRS